MTETDTIQLRSDAKPLLVSTDDASFICGVSPERFRSVAETIGIRPVLQAGNGRAKWSLPEIVERLKNWTAWDDNRRREEAVVVDVGRTRAPRQAFMKNKVKKG